MVSDQHALALAASQLGLITRQQAHGAGMSNSQIRARVARGAWRSVHPSVFHAGTAPLTTEQRLLAASLATSAPVSHTSAAWLMGLVEQLPGSVHVLSHSAANHRRTGIVVHRVDGVLPGDRTRIRGIPSTSPTRTLLDLAAELSETELRTVVHRGLRLRLTHTDRLLERFAAQRSRGRHGARKVHRILSELDQDAALLESDLESMLLAVLIEAGLPAPKLQHWIRVAGQEYRADFAYPEHRVVIEGDGFGVHSARDAFESDRVRQNHLIVAGWRVLRFTWRQIVRQPEWVAAQVRAALRTSGPSVGIE
jgi:very-short-patch-repair endonuclease